MVISLRSCPCRPPIPFKPRRIVYSERGFSPLALALPIFLSSQNSLNFSFFLSITRSLVHSLAALLSHIKRNEFVYFACIQIVWIARRLPSNWSTSNGDLFLHRNGQTIDHSNGPTARSIGFHRKRVKKHGTHGWRGRWNWDVCSGKNMNSSSAENACG